MAIHWIYTLVAKEVSGAHLCSNIWTTVLRFWEKYYIFFFFVCVHIFCVCIYIYLYSTERCKIILLLGKRQMYTDATADGTSVVI